MSILWIKALHVFFMIAWMAGIFYLPRLFVYHAQTDNQSVRDQFKIMERRLWWLGVVQSIKLVAYQTGVSFGFIWLPFLFIKTLETICSG